MVLWSRLYFDLEPYLTERAADGASLMTFYHASSARRCTSNTSPEMKGARHRELAGYFGYLRPEEPRGRRQD